jgi:hypothetical protein
LAATEHELGGVGPADSAVSQPGIEAAGVEPRTAGCRSLPCTGGSALTRGRVSAQS